MPIDANHQFAPEGTEVQMSANTFRLAPIRTCPAPAVGAAPSKNRSTARRAVWGPTGAMVPAAAVGVTLRV